MSHVIYKSAFVQDAAAIAERAGRVGAHVVLDVYQSAGTVPVNLGALGVSFAVGGSIKWLCGGPGAGYLYVRPDLSSLAPRLTGWMAHARPFGFEPELERRTDAYRFLNGTPSIPNLYIAREGYRILRDVGVAAVREKSLRQTARLMDLADELGLPVRTPRDPARRGGTLSLDVPRGLDVARELNRRDIVVDYRPGAACASPPTSTPRTRSASTRCASWPLWPPPGEDPPRDAAGREPALIEGMAVWPGDTPFRRIASRRRRRGCRDRVGT